VVTTREEIERQVREHFPRPVQACGELLDLADDLLKPVEWRGRALAEQGHSRIVDRIMVSEAARGLKTCRASYDLCLGGFGPQAAMMNRALFEGMAVAYWTRAHPADAAEMFAKHQRLARALWSERMVAEGEPPLDELPDEQELDELKRTFGRWHTKLWCGLAVHDLVDAIEPEWENPQQLRSFYRIAHTDHNETAHTTAMSLASPVITDEDNEFEVDAGRSLHYVERGLVGGFWTYSHLLGVAADYFEIAGRERVSDMHVRGLALIAPLDEDDLKDVGRNDPCPCRSGLKFKHCHGA
jgi:hypothetical protein